MKFDKVGAARPNLLLDSLIYFQTFKNGGIKIQFIYSIISTSESGKLEIETRRRDHFRYYSMKTIGPPSGPEFLSTWKYDNCFIESGVCECGKWSWTRNCRTKIQGYNSFLSYGPVLNIFQISFSNDEIFPVATNTAKI
jgi:hypothetical protein